MKGFKKIIFMAILAVMVALCSFGAVTAFADENISQTTKDVNISANELSIQVGESATLTYKAKGYANVAGFHFIINLPSNVTFSNFEIADGFKKANYQYTVNGSQVSVICNSGNEQVTNEIELFDIEVVGREVGGGDAWFIVALASDVNANNIQCFAQSTYIEVLGEPEEIIIKGDVDGDKQVGVQDLMLMQRYVLGTLGYDTTFITSAGDIDGDYDIDLIDCQQVQRYLVSKISFEELQNISNGSGSGDVENPELPSDAEIVYDVKIDGQMHKQALRVNRNDLSSVFNYKGRELVGKTYSLSMIDPTLPENSLAFIEYGGTELFGFVIDQWGIIELEEYVNFSELVKDQPTGFNSNYAGEYKIINGREMAGTAYVDNNGVFTGSVNIYRNGTYFSINVNGLVTYASTDEGRALVYVFGMIPQELTFDFEKRSVTILKNGQETGNEARFVINYYLKSGESIVREAVYNITENDDIYEVAKMLAYQYLEPGYEIADYKLNFMQNGSYQIEAWIYERNGYEGEEPTQGKKIMLYMFVSDNNHYMLQPMNEINVSSVEEFKQMLGYFSVIPEGNPMKLVGLYVDDKCTILYDDSMGIDIDNLYVCCEYLSDVSMVTGLGGNYNIVRDDDTGMQVQIPGSLTINDQTETFELVLGDVDAVRYTGEVIVSSLSYDEFGNPTYASVAMITKNNVQISGSLMLSNDETISSFNIYSIEDFSTKETVEDLKKYAGEYTTYVQAMGLNMAKCSTVLQDNGVFTLQMFFMKQIGTYEIILDATGNTLIVLTVEDSPMEATINFETKEIFIVQQMSGPSVDMGENEIVSKYVAHIVVVGTYEAFQAILPEDSYDVLKQELYNMFGDKFSNCKIYLDEGLTTELSFETFDTVNRTFFVVFDSTDVNSGYQDGKVESTDKVIIINQ